MKSRRRAWWRRTYMIEPRVQLKIVGLLAGISTIAAIAICVIAYRHMMALSALFNHSIVPPVAVPAHFQMIADSLMYRLVGVVLLMVFAFIVTGVLLTHKIAGPIWKLQRELAKFLNGEPVPPISFRDGDEYRELPGLVNKLMDGYKKGPGEGPRA